MIDCEYDSYKFDFKLVDSIVFELIIESENKLVGIEVILLKYVVEINDSEIK